jgi:superfamily II DNA or RNA helicase
MTAADVRHVIARAVLVAAHDVGDTLGTITLRPHQTTAASRLVSLISANGGAMLAEPVGIGKTYTALAVAARFGEPRIVVVPASLRGMWLDALDRCAIRARVVTHEAMSRSRPPSMDAGFVIVDEAHGFRTPSTQRYAAVAELCRRSRVLLVTATPVQNRRNDIASQIALYLGRRAWQLSDEELAEHVVRGTAAETIGLPRLEGPHRLILGTDDDCLDEILALPPPLPAKDETIVMALLTYGLVHQWTSSRAALVASLQRRRTRGLALLSALESGRRPTRAELSAWTHAPDAMQLAFPELVTSAASDSDLDIDAMGIALERHTSALASLLRLLRDAPSPDVERAEVLRRVCASHTGERVIAFCHYAETVNAVRLLLAHDPGVASLTANGARVAGGRVSRETVLSQFTPPRDSSRAVNRAEQIDLLITTDLLSEGLNLQEASVIVHLDLPWNPARLDQRVGRVRRLGSRHEQVTVYAVAPPAAAERLIRLEERLREKLSLAQRTVGIAGRILPSPLGAVLPAPSLAEQTSAIRDQLGVWIVPDRARVAPASVEPAAASVDAELCGFLAAVRDQGGAVHLVAELGTGVTTSTDAIARALAVASGRNAEIDPRQMAMAHRQLERWLVSRQGASTIDFHAAATARLRRATLTRVAQALARAPRHRHALLAPLADAARSIATAPLGEGAERVLETLVRAELPDEAWLRSIATFGELNARPLDRPHRDSGETQIVALILFARREAESPELHG